jgi:hypothetical protein
VRIKYKTPVRNIKGRENFGALGTDMGSFYETVS